MFTYSNNIILGIDPGLTGGIVIFDGKRILEKHIIPIIKESRNGKIKNEIDLKSLNTIILTAKSYNPKCFLEKVGAMPGQGVSSMFAFGKGFGILIGMLTAHEIETTLVPPQKWTALIHKPYSHTSMESKEKSKLIAKNIFPNEDFLATSKSKIPHAGLVDAALIAVYGYKIVSSPLD
jgi:crossover junction endodeoxyribonuclease RuvC